MNLITLFYIIKQIFIGVCVYLQLQLTENGLPHYLSKLFEDRQINSIN